MKIICDLNLSRFYSIVWILVVLHPSDGRAENSHEDYADNDYNLGGWPPPPKVGPVREYGIASSSMGADDVESRLPRPYDKNCPSPKSNLESLKHPCTRICQAGVQLKCEFEFRLDYYLTNSAACGNCSQNDFENCTNPKCILADGVRRVVAIVNGKMPGPSIRVCEGDTVVVNVENHLDEGATIHWHGIHQKGTPFMDGVPGITQCAIPPRGHFRYEFTTPVFGTYFWHSHSLFQRGDGVYGSLIVRRPPENDPHGPKNGNLYDCDLPEHELIVMDWQEQYGRDIFTNAVLGDTSFRPRNALVNGKGFPRLRFTNNPEIIPATNELRAWLEEIVIERDKRYRLRLISNTIVSCPFQVSIENHKMAVIASDGFDLQPEVVDSLVLYPGERWDVVVKGDQTPGVYWIKFRGLNFCRNISDPRTSIYQVAVLRYRGYEEPPDHVIADWYQAKPPGGYEEINSFNTYSQSARHITVAELKSLQTDDPEIITGRASHQFFLPFDFNRVDNITVTGPHTPASLANVRGTLQSPQINHVSYVMPKTPLLTQPGASSFKFICNNTNEIFNIANPDDKRGRSVNPDDPTATPTCVNNYCACTHLLKVKKDAIVELVLIDIGVPLNASHPFHLHGHSFRVTDIQKLGVRTTVEQVREHMKRPERILARQRALAPVKDTVNVQDGGYTVIRFRADNPGFWFFHCHVEFHAEVGMGLVFQVGERAQMTPTPVNFPICGTDTGSHSPDNHSPIRNNEEESISLYRDNYFRIFDGKLRGARAHNVEGRSFIITGKTSWTIFEGRQFNGRHLCIQPRPKNGQYLLPHGWSVIGSVEKHCRREPYNYVGRRPFK